MNTIIISGPSGSGKSFLAKILSNLLPDTIIIRTDSFYKDSILIKCLSLIVYDIYDRPLSIKSKELMNNIKSIRNQARQINSFYYDFKRRKSFNKKINLNYNDENQFLIIEGIFSHRLDIDYKNTINIICEEDKEICLQRRLIRDKHERGRNDKEIQKKFYKSWDLFFQNIEKFIKNNHTTTLKSSEKISYNDLVIKLIKSTKK